MVHHELPFLPSPSFLARINSTLINYDFSIWMWVNAMKYLAWTYFSSQSESVVAAFFLRQRDAQEHATQENVTRDAPMQQMQRTSQKRTTEVLDLQEPTVLTESVKATKGKAVKGKAVQTNQRLDATSRYALRRVVGHVPKR